MGRLVVPHQDRTLAPPSAERVRRFRRHLVECFRDLRKARRPERLVQSPVVPPEEAAVPVLQAGCVACRGFCCLGGEDHAYLDERAMARVRRDRPALTERGVIAAYLAQIAPQSFQDSCLFHGAQGCTLDPTMRARLCHSFFCSPLREYLRHGVFDSTTEVVPGEPGWDGGRVAPPRPAERG